ncbi:MAG: hypothetical protein NTY20_02575 [Candidatus Aenigmarchaeota archaeon]|nr:hypothetical protein [Candidatus Aenigmarchaeota archaeon]
MIREKKEYSQNPHLDIEKEILELLQIQRLSSDTIAFILQLPSYKIDKELSKMARWGLVRKSTARPLNFWEVLNGKQ